MNRLTLTLEAGLPSERLQELTRELVRDLSAQPGLQAQPSTSKLSGGEKSIESIDVGQILIAFLGGTGAKALLDCLKAYVSRERSLKLKLQRSDGVSIEITAVGFQPDQIVQTSEMVQALVNGCESYRNE